VVINAVGPIHGGKSKTPDVFDDEIRIGSDTVTA
jgi:hypothetical protein